MNNVMFQKGSHSIIKMTLLKRDRVGRIRHIYEGQKTHDAKAHYRHIEIGEDTRFYA